MMNEQEIMQKLQEPFPPEDIEWRVGSTNKDKTMGLALAYVTNRAIQNRLDNIFGPFGWRNEFKEWKSNSQLCGISIKFGDEWITKWDGADDSNMEAVKGGLSDSMKRAAYQWGIGRYLYKLPQTWVEIAPAGRSYRLKRTPKLPDWAIPEGCEQEEQTEEKSMPTPALKAKWQTLAGDLNGFDKWYNEQVEKGFSNEQMNAFLAKKLQEKQEERAS